MVIDKIQKDVYEKFGCIIITHQEEDEVSAYVYTTYPGDYILKVYSDETQFTKLDFTFTTEADYIMFALQYL